MITKLNIGLSISRNFNKVTLEMVEEPVEHQTEEQLINGIRGRFDLLRSEVEKEFGEMKR